MAGLPGIARVPLMNRARLAWERRRAAALLGAQPCGKTTPAMAHDIMDRRNEK